MKKLFVFLCLLLLVLSGSLTIFANPHVVPSFSLQTNNVHITDINLKLINNIEFVPMKLNP